MKKRELKRLVYALANYVRQDDTEDIVVPCLDDDGYVIWKSYDLKELMSKVEVE